MKVRRRAGEPGCPDGGPVKAPLDATAAVLAGGRSSRFGGDKALAPLRGRSLIEHVVAQLKALFAEVILSTDDPGRYRFLGLETAVDSAPGRGPLAGIGGALRAARHDRVFVVACDIPFVDGALVERLVEAAASADCALPILDGRHVEPLFAVYRRRVLPIVEELLRSGGGPVRLLHSRVSVRKIAVPESDWYANLNTRADYLRYLDRDAAGKGTPERG